MKTSLAKVISLLLGFPLVIFLMAYGILLSEINGTSLLFVTTGLLVFEVVIPILVLIYLYKKGKISDIDIVDRKERILPFVIVLCLFAVGVAFSRIYGTEFLFRLQLMLFITVCLNFVITLFWKISLHMAIVTLSVIVLVFYAGMSMLPFALCIPLVYWARLYLKRHTHAQLIAGFVVNSILSIGLLNYFR